MSTVCTLVLILFNIQSSVTQVPPLGFAWQHALWSKHNELRSEIAVGNIHSQPFSTNMEHIFYESNLETIPLNHALQCNYTHNPALSQQVNQISDQLSFAFSAFDRFGENIAYDSIGPFLDSDNLQSIIQQQWFESHQYYNYNANQCLSNVTDCSSYEKLLWAKTRYMACGVSICAALHLPHEHKTISNAAFIVCNYWPSYDKDELPIYNTLPINTPNDIPQHLCSDCALDRTQCSNGLCSGCPAPNYNYCQDRLLVCPDSTDKCNTDPIIRMYCTYSCSCSADDWIAETPCDDLYLYIPTTAPTNKPTTDDCRRLGWYNVTALESDPTIQCPVGYMLPGSTAHIGYIRDNCLIGDDEARLDYVTSPGYAPHGIAMDWVQYDIIGCAWNTAWDKGVIPTHTGIKCGDSMQLFVCAVAYITTEAPSIMSTTSEPISAAPTTLQPSTYRPSWAPSDKPTAEPTEVDDTEAPTSAPTEGPTFSPTAEPTNEPSEGTTISPVTNAPTTGNPTTATPTAEPTVSVEYEPFPMYLLFPEALSEVAMHVGHERTSRRLAAVHVRQMVDNDNDVELYPLDMAYKSLDVDRDNNGYGYAFNLSRKMDENVVVGLSQIIYTIDVKENLCGLDIDIDGLDGTLVQFKFFNKYQDEWRVESVGYNVKFSDDYVGKRWIDIIIEVDGGYKLMFDVAYMFVIDLSLLMENCMDLSHVIYAKSFGNFNVEKNSFMVNGLKSVELLNGNQVNQYRYWMRMCMKFN